MSQAIGPGAEGLAPPPGARLVMTGGCGGIGRALVTVALGLQVTVVSPTPSLHTRERCPSDRRRRRRPGRRRRRVR